jgi:hypothetical protein
MTNGRLVLLPVCSSNNNWLPADEMSSWLFGPWPITGLLDQVLATTAIFNPRSPWFFGAMLLMLSPTESVFSECVVVAAGVKVNENPWLTKRRPEMNTNRAKYSHPFQLFQCVQRPLRPTAFRTTLSILIRTIDHLIVFQLYTCNYQSLFVNHLCWLPTEWINNSTRTENVSSFPYTAKS